MTRPPVTTVNGNSPPKKGVREFFVHESSTLLEPPLCPRARGPIPLSLAPDIAA